MKTIFCTGVRELNAQLLTRYPDMERIAELNNYFDIRNILNLQINLIIINGFLGTTEDLMDVLVFIRMNNPKCRIIVAMQHDDIFREKVSNIGIHEILELDDDGSIDEIEIYNIIEDRKTFPIEEGKVSPSPERHEKIALKILKKEREDVLKTKEINQGVDEHKARTYNFKQSKTVIAIGSTEPCCGCTYQALLLASWLVDQRKKTTLIEYNKRPSLHIMADTHAKEFCIGKVPVHQSDLESGGISYSRFNQSEYIILDLGELKEMNEDNIFEKTKQYYEMERANVQILIGSAAIWRMGKTILFNYAKNDLDNWKVLLTGGGTSLSQARAELGDYFRSSNVHLSPFASTPTLSQGHDDLFRKILSEFLILDGNRTMPFWRKK